MKRQLRQLLTILLVCGSARAGEKEDLSSAAKHRRGAIVAIITDGEMLRGRIVEVTADSVSLQAQLNTNEYRIVPFREIKALRQDPWRNLKTGRVVSIQKANGDRFRGQLVTAGLKEFSILPEKGSTPIAVNYSDCKEYPSRWKRTKHVGKNIGLGALMAPIVIPALPFILLTLPSGD